MGMHFSILLWMIDIAEASVMCQVWNEYSVDAMSYLLCCDDSDDTYLQLRCS